MTIGNASIPAQGPARPIIARLSERGLGRLAAWCYDHRRRVLAGWMLAVVAVIGLAQWAGSRLDNDFALAGAQSPLTPGGSGQLSADRRTGFLAVRFDAPAAELPAAAVRQVIGTARSFARPGLQVAYARRPPVISSSGGGNA